MLLELLVRIYIYVRDSDDISSQILFGLHPNLS